MLSGKHWNRFIFFLSFVLPLLSGRFWVVANSFRWSEDGLRIQLLSPQALENILPKYFSHNNYRSLTKMLNANGFTKACPPPPLFSTMQWVYHSFFFLFPLFSVVIYHFSRFSFSDAYLQVPKKDSHGVEYKHDMFQRGRLDLLPGVARAPTASGKHRRDSDDDLPPGSPYIGAQGQAIAEGIGYLLVWGIVCCCCCLCIYFYIFLYISKIFLYISISLCVADELMMVL